MSSCKFTENIKDYECLGDSLKKINNNFANLDSGLCEIPSPNAGSGISITPFTTEQEYSFYKVATTNSFQYGTRFDSSVLCTNKPLSLADGSALQVLTFPYLSVEDDPKPTATFTAVAQTANTPKVTLYWTASGNDYTTVYPLNSAISELNKGKIWFNGPVTTIVEASPTSLYVAGGFTEVNGEYAEKNVEIDISVQGGKILGVPMPNLGKLGEIKSLKKTSVVANFANNELLIAAGSFESIGIRGKGLLIYNKTTKIYYPWYVNGEVNALEIIGNTLYVGGMFDYINYGSSSASEYSGQRFCTKGFFSLNLTELLEGLVLNALTDRSAEFSTNATIYCFATYNNMLFIGGDFSIRNNNVVTYKNLCSYNLSDFSLIETWKPLTNGPVYTLTIDNTISRGGSVFLYIGGKFTSYHTFQEYYSEPRSKKSDHKCYNAVAVRLTQYSDPIIPYKIVPDWKPKVKGTVTRFISHDNEPDSFVYCYGSFQSISEHACSHIAALRKVESTVKNDLVHPTWKPGLQKGPNEFSPNSIYKTANNTLIIGGNFTQVGDSVRYNLVEVADIKNYSLLTHTLSSIVWDCGAHILSPGMNLNIDYFSSTTMRVTSYPVDFQQLNATEFLMDEEQFKGIVPGQPIRFFIRRPGLSCYTNDTLKIPAHVISWKVDFNE
jgi:hypothetical protein